MAELEAAERAEPEATQAARLGRELADRFDDVIEEALGELLAAVGETGLGLAELRAIRALAASASLPTAGGRSLEHADLARATGLSTASLRAALAALEKRGMVATPKAGAARLTDRGRTLYRQLRSRRQAALTAFVRSRGHGERLRLAGALHLLDPRFDARLGSG